MGEDADAGQLGQHREVAPHDGLGHRAGVRVEGDLVALHRPVASDLGHRERRPRLGRGSDLERTFEAAGAGAVHGVLHGDERGVTEGHRLGPECRRRALDRVDERAEAAAGVVRPGQPGGAEEQQRDGEPDPGRAVPTHDPAPAGTHPPRREQRGRGLAAASALADPQCEAAEDDDPQPAGGELGVEPAGLAEEQVAVQGVERGLQRRGVEPRVERPADAGGVGVDVDGALGVFGQPVDVQHHAGGAAGVGVDDEGVERALGVRGGRCGDLIVERPLRTGVRADQELVGVDEVGQLRAEHVDDAGQAGDREERRDEHAGIEVQAQDERSEDGPAGARRGPGVGGAFTGRVSSVGVGFSATGVASRGVTASGVVDMTAPRRTSEVAADAQGRPRSGAAARWRARGRGTGGGWCRGPAVTC